MAVRPHARQRPLGGYCPAHADQRRFKGWDYTCLLGHHGGRRHDHYLRREASSGNRVAEGRSASVDVPESGKEREMTLSALTIEDLRRRIGSEIGISNRLEVDQKLISSEERRVGKEWVSTCICRGLPDP